MRAGSMLYDAFRASIRSAMNWTSLVVVPPWPARQTRGPAVRAPDGYTTISPCSSATAFHREISIWAAAHSPAPCMLMTSGVGRVAS